MKEQINNYQFEKISSNMAKEFGTIKKGNEEEYSFILFTMEANLLKTNRIFKINNGRRVIEAIHACLFIVNGYLNQTEYELSEYITRENEPYIKGLLASFDPFTNEQIISVAGQEYNLESLEDLHEYFTIPVKCLLRIEDSVAVWTKSYGINGYFNFLENQLGQTVEHDDKMNFTVTMPRK